MASYTVLKRQKASGEWRYTTNVRVKKNGKILHREARTFSRSQAAHQWGKRRVADIEERGFNDSSPIGTLGELISAYINDPHVELGKTKKNTLQLVRDSAIADVELSGLSSQDIVNHCKARREAGAGPATIAHDVSYIRSVLKTARSLRGFDVGDQCVVDSYETLYKLNLIGKSARRTRRPTDDELKKLRKGLAKREAGRSAVIPYIDILDFSILSCMRVGEVCSILWEDVDDEQKAVMVRNRKDPRKKSGNHMLVPLLGGAWEILQRQEKTSERVFPFNARSVAAGFQRVRNELCIKDLRYHDMRREGASRLFEKGYKIDEVAQVTGHRNINTLWLVYTELFPSRLQDKD